MTGDRDIIVMGASAGGVEALRTVAAGLPADLPAAVFVALHMSPEGPGLLPPLLARAGPLPAQEAADGERFERGRIYVARPDHHLILEDGRTRVVRGPKENRARPAVDPLFRSAAIAHGPRVVGVVLTGALNDGAAGLAVVKKHGGLAVVQDPEDALFDSMPRSALQAVAVDHVVPASGLAGLLAGLVGPTAREKHARGEGEAVEVSMGSGHADDVEKAGRPSVYGCPACGGVLNEMDDPALLRFRCRAGHAYTAEALLAEQDEAVEGTLWAALRALEESAGLKLRLADRLRHVRAGAVAARLDWGAQEAEKHAESLRRLLGSLEKQAER